MVKTAHSSFTATLRVTVWPLVLCGVATAPDGVTRSTDAGSIQSGASTVMVPVLGWFTHPPNHGRPIVWKFMLHARTTCRASPTMVRVVMAWFDETDDDSTSPKDSASRTWRATRASSAA